MKFLSGILSFKVDKRQIKVNIPFYHRVALGLITGTKVYVYPRKTESQVPNSNQKLDIREVVLSQFKPNKWEYIWKLEISALDSPGLTSQVTEVLEKLEVNIFIQESLIANYEQDFTITIIADFKKFFERLDKVTFDNIDEIKRQLETQFKPCEGEYDFGIHIQKIEPIKFLTNISEKEVSKRNTQGNGSKNLVNTGVLHHYYNEAGPIPVDEVGITLEQHLVENLKVSDFTNSSNIVEGTIFSDTEEKYLIIRFFPRNQKVVHLEIIHPNLDGAIHAFTKEINKAHKEYNIISSYNRIDDDIFYAHWNVLIDVTSYPQHLPYLIRELERDYKEHKVTVIKKNFSESLKAEGIKELGESEKDVQKRINDLNKAAKSNNVAIIKTTPNQEIFIKKDLLNEKEYRLNTLNHIKNFINYNAGKRKKRFQLLFGLLSVAYIITNFALFMYLGWGAFEPIGYFVGSIIIPAIFLLSMCVTSEHWNPIKFFKKIEDNYKTFNFQRLGYNLQELNKINTEIENLRKEVESVQIISKQ